ncbi:MAG: pullulanase-type alpha-1,6-glucosidase, partial [Micromonosporaceae bacterium]
GGYPYLDAEGRPFDDREYASGERFPEMTAEGFPYTPEFRSDADRNAKTPDWLNDPTMYHNRGDSTFAGESAEYGDFVGLDDLFTERPEVVRGMVEIYQKWVRDAGVDGFRIDTVKHVNMEFWQRFVPELEGYAAKVGNDDFFMFGEVFSADPAVTSRYTRDGQLPAVLDFPFQDTARGYASRGGAATDLQKLYASDDRHTDADSNAYANPTFLGNHDMGRFGGFVARDNPDSDDAELLRRQLLGHELMYLGRGQPVVYYGDEQGFTGPGGDKDARQPMFASKTADYLDDDLLGTDATHATDNYRSDHPVYRGIAALAKLRDRHPALADGAQIHRYADTGPGVYAFSRFDARKQVEYLVAVNNADTSRTVPVKTYGGRFDRLYPSDGASVTAGADGRISVTVPALSAVVFKARERATPPGTAPAVAITAPTPDSSVRGLAEVSADVPGDGFAQVTFAAKVGNGEWQAIGTDDNRPFRVYHDLAGVPADTKVAYKAVVTDAAGRIASARSDAVVGAPPAEDPVGQRDWLVVHYARGDGNYDGWGLHVWGDVAQPTDWSSPRPFSGEDSYGRFAWVKLKPGASQVGYLVHRGDEKDCAADRSVDVARTGEMWLKPGGCEVATSQAAALGYATVHYKRPDGQYDGWGLHLWGDAVESGTSWDDPLVPDGVDAGGAYWKVPLKDPSAPLNFIVHSGDTKDPGPDQSFVPERQPHGYVNSGEDAVHPTRAAAEGKAVIHYHRPSGDHDGWGLHTWTGAADPTDWQDPLLPARTDDFGAVYEVPLADGAESLSYILHRGDEKDLPDDQSLEIARFGNEVWVLAATPGYLLPMRGGTGPDADLTRSKAVWIDESTVAWPGRTPPGVTYQLLYGPDGGIAVDSGGKVTGEHKVIRLSVVDGGLSGEQRARLPHLADYMALRVDPRDADRVVAATRGQLVAAERDGNGVVRTATGVQTGELLDALYASRAADARLGPVWTDGRPTLSLWAPTAHSVALELYDSPDAAQPRLATMERNDATGVWSVTGDPTWKGRYYAYRVTVYSPAGRKVVTSSVLDPYAVSVAADSGRGWLGDLSDPSLAPDGWAGLTKPAPVATHAASVYELHVRDFSASDATVPAADRGGYRGFTDPDSAGMRHLAGLADAGLSHVQLLPVQDFATVPERRGDRTEPDCDYAAMPPDSPRQQECAARFAATDSFNWGYDPTGAFSVPEGSYASRPDGPTRVAEMRGAVAGLNRAGLRMVLDVVYNHAHASGLDPGSVLDRIVPGYYHRLLADGTVATSTCCANTAPEHAMMGKLVVDSVVTWARHYKVDGFRFDLMGHHPRANMVAVRQALDALTLERDGVDGRAILLYGEGWNFGEIADNARFPQATQLELAGTGIGSFNDRLRDAVRGGGPFDADPRVQGLASGLGTADNGAPVNGDAAARDARLLRYHDQIKVGMVGNLAGYEFTGSDGVTRSGRDVDYNGAPTGYTAQPGEAVTYADAHDNETLYDALAYKLPPATTMADRVKLQQLGLATVLLGQGLGFVHAGSEQLRSKSLDRNSYDSGDWFNRLPWDCTAGNGFGSGLPPAPDNEDKWQYAKPLLADPGLKPDCTAIEDSRARFAELLRMRTSTPLFSLGTAASIGSTVSFPLTGDGRDAPGLLAMHVADPADVDTRWASVTVLVNAGATRPLTLPELAGTGARLHPVQAEGVDPDVRAVRVGADGGLTVPARSVVVLVAPR